MVPGDFRRALSPPVDRVIPETSINESGLIDIPRPEFTRFPSAVTREETVAAGRSEILAQTAGTPISRTKLRRSR